MALSHAVFGESMFAHKSNASKLALAALISFCLEKGVQAIDCQQNTRHLASLGAHEMHRSEFVAHVRKAIQLPALTWDFDPLYWKHILDI